MNVYHDTGRGIPIADTPPPKPHSIKPRVSLSDARRAILVADGDAMVYCVVLPPHSYAGSHYHTDKTESVYVVSGTAFLKIAHENQEDGSTNIDRVRMTAGKGICIPPMFAHKFETEEEGAVLLVTADKDAGEMGTARVTM